MKAGGGRGGCATPALLYARQRDTAIYLRIRFKIAYGVSVGGRDADKAKRTVQPEGLGRSFRPSKSGKRKVSLRTTRPTG